METDKKSDAADHHAPRNLSFSENVALTIKVLMGAVLLMAVLWGLNELVSVK